jgi:hypothetical protein
VDPDPVTGRQKRPTENNSEEISCFSSAECSLWRAGGFFCTLEVLHGSLRKNTLQFFFFRKNNYLLYFSCKFFSVLFIVILDLEPGLDPDSPKSLDPN